MPARPLERLTWNDYILDFVNINHVQTFVDLQ